MKRLLFAVPIVALAVGGSTACATKGFVKTRVAEVNDKVETVSKSLEETQERVRQNEQKIGQVDQRVGQVDQRVGQVDQKVGQVDQKTDAVNAKADAIDARSKRLIYEVTLSEDQGGFKFGQANLPSDAEAKLDELVNQLKANPNGAYLEIEGHTDNRGPAAYNEKLGLERAEAVERYLYEKHNVPLHKMSVISYGAEKPVAPNKTKAGRAQNRRVVIKVLT